MCRRLSDLINVKIVTKTSHFIYRMRTHVWRKSFTRLSQRNQRLPFQRRHFHPATRQLNSNSPTDPSDLGKSEAEKDSGKKQAEENGEEIKNGRRQSLRRSRIYSKQPREVPSFTVPNWFLKHNVRLQKATTRTKNDNAVKRSLNLVDRDTGHVVLTLPFTDFLNPDGKPVQSNKLANFFSPKDVAVSKDIGQSANEKVEGSGAVKEDAKRAAKQLSPDPTDNSPEPRLLMFLQVQLLLQATFAITGPAAVKLDTPNLELQTSDPFAHDDLDRFVEEVADLMHADLIRLDANDLSELAGEYLDNGEYHSGSISALPYDVYGASHAATKPMDSDLNDDFANEEPSDPADIDPDAMEDASFGAAASPFGNVDIAQLGKFFQQNADKLTKALGDGRRPIAINLARLNQTRANSANSSENLTRSSSFTIGPWDELKLQTLLDTILDSTASKRDAGDAVGPASFLRNSFQPPNPPAPESTEAATEAAERPREAELTKLLKEYLVKRIDSPSKDHSVATSIQDDVASTGTPASDFGTRTIVHIRDLEAIRRTPQGEAIVRLLSKVLQRRRKDGQQIVMVGTSASSHSSIFDIDPEEEEESSFRTIQYLGPSPAHSATASSLVSALTNHKLDRTLAKPGYQRLVDINLRNIQSMIRRLGLTASDLLFAPVTRGHMNIPGTWKIGDYALSQDDIQEIVLYAESLRTTYTHSSRLDTFHIAFATALKQSIENTLGPLTGFPVEPIIPTARPRGSSKGPGDSSKRQPAKVDIEQLKKSCDKHEKKLLGGVVDPQSLRTTFSDVHATPDTIEALKTLTSLSLMRPEAFQYGVLANDRLPGLLLYGPPGTGKTMLAKAVAKESQATVLEVSGAQVYEKYVGEGEKMVKAVFSLAKKLSPCVVFIDEADALFGSRGGANNRTTHREIINQFLREWDGMDDHSVFMMVATNRPFDLDDAVLRRLPRRLLVDLPVAKDRESILGIHLKGETLDSSVSLNKLAEQTPLYSGSDLKNVAVSAALAAVKEENDLLVQHKDDKSFKLPERRTLTSKHFERALAEISASINEDMQTLGAIRKFDEQYGDRRAKKKKVAYGFGGMEQEVNENAARVRQDDPKP